jgi:hypothetical protein
MTKGPSDARPRSRAAAEISWNVRTEHIAGCADAKSARGIKQTLCTEIDATVDDGKRSRTLKTGAI